MEKMKTKRRFPLFHGTTAAIFRNSFTIFVALGIWICPLSLHAEHTPQQGDILRPRSEDDGNEISHRQDAAADKLSDLTKARTHAQPSGQARDQQEKMTACGNDGYQ